MLVNREELLRQLESVQAGTTLKETTEQSSCIAFRNGQAISFSDEVACFGPCSLQLEGAVPAAPLIALLQKLPEDELVIEDLGGEVKIKGKGRGMKIAKEKEISMPIENLEAASSWKPLNEDFADAIRAVGDCAAPSKSEEYIMTCIHVHPNWVEACDNFQCARWKLETGITRPSLIKRDSIKHVAHLGMTEMAETDSWVHFRNPAGLHTACRRTVDEYKDTADLFKMPDASPLALPKGLADEIDRAIVFAKDGPTGEYVRVELRSEGKMKIRGIGRTGQFWAVKTIQYSGPPLSFMISPKLLMDIAKKYNEVKVGSSRLKAKGGGFTYVTVLGAITKEEDAQAGE